MDCFDEDGIVNSTLISRSFYFLTEKRCHDQRDNMTTRDNFKTFS